MNKSRLAIAALVMALAGTGVAAAASVNGEYKGYPIVRVIVNGKAVQGDAPGILLDNTTLVPLRAVSESLGANVSWDPDTSTATVVLAASAQEEKGSGVAEDEAERKLKTSVEQLLKRTETYMEHPGVVREKIRIAKEFYEIRKENYYLAQLSAAYWSEFEKQFAEILSLAASDELNQAKPKYRSISSIMAAAEKAHEAMADYKMAADQYNSYVEFGRAEFQQFYIASYSKAFEEELAAKKLLDEARTEWARESAKSGSSS